MAEKSASLKAAKGVRVRESSAGPSLSKSERLAKEMDRLKNEYGSELIRLAATESDGLRSYNPAQAARLAGPAAYPIKPYPDDSWDNIVKLKQDIGDKLGQRVLTSDDLKWAQRKQDAITSLNFKRFVNSLYDQKDPAQLAILEKVYPELAQEKEQILEQRAALQLMIAKLRLRGAKSQEEMRLLYAISSGAMKLPTGALWEPEAWDNAQTNPTAVAPGLFNPRRVLQGKVDANYLPFDDVFAVKGPDGTSVGQDPSGAWNSILQQSGLGGGGAVAQ